MEAEGEDHVVAVGVRVHQVDPSLHGQRLNDREEGLEKIVSLKVSDIAAPLLRGRCWVPLR